MCKRGRVRFLLLAVVMVVWSGCLSPYEGEEDGGGLPGKGGVIAETVLFKEEGAEGGRRVTHFRTTDKKYRTSGGYTLWTAGDGGEGSLFSTRTVWVQKADGSLTAGYGLVICEGERGGERVFLTVMINKNGEYAIGKVVGGRYTSIMWWTKDKNIRGKGLVDTIRVARDVGDSNKYHIYINDLSQEVVSFMDTVEPRCGSVGRSGYIVVIGPEDLDGTAVDVVFEE